MKRKVYGIIAALVVAFNLGVGFVVPAFATETASFSGRTYDSAEAHRDACKKLGGTWKTTAYANYTVWDCKNANASGSTDQVSRSAIKSACESLGGTFEVISATTSTVLWVCNGGTDRTTVNNGGSTGTTNTSTTNTGTTNTGTTNTSTTNTGTTTNNGDTSGLRLGYKADGEGGDCAGVDTAIIKCNSGSGGGALFEVLSIILNVVTYGVGAAAIIGVIITGYQYMTARDNSAQVAKAKNRLLQIVIGLVIWVFFWGILQFLLPGGLFGNGS